MTTRRNVTPAYPTFNDIFNNESCHDQPTHILGQDDNPFVVKRQKSEPVAVNNPGTLFGKEENGLDPLVEELLKQVKALEDNNAALREELQDVRLEKQKLENILQQTQRATGKLQAFLNQHRALFTG